MSSLNKPNVSTRPLASFALKRRHSLRWRLLILLGGILLATLLIIGVGVYTFIFDTEQRTWRQRQDEAARYAAEVVSSFMERTISSMNVVGLLDAELLAAQPDLLDQLLKQNPALLEIVRLDNRGHVISGASKDAPIIANQFTIPQSVWFQQAAKGELYLGSVEISATSQPYLIIAAHASDGGVVAARLQMNVLWDVVADLTFGETGQAYIVNQEGQIVAHTNVNIALARTNLRNRPELEAILNASDEQSTNTYFNFANIEVVGVNRPVADTKWVVVTEVPTAEVFATSQTALFLLGGGLAICGFVVMIVTGRFLGQLIIKPMERLRTGAVQIGRGDLRHQIDLVSHNEVGQVALAFNTMAKQLHEREETLKRQREFLQQVIDINPHFIFAKDVDGRYVLANKAFTDAYRTSLDNLLGKTDKDLNPNNELVEKYRREEIQVINTGQELRHDEEKIINIRGQEVWRKTIKRPIFDKNGSVNQVLGVATDITDRKKAEEALELARDQALEASRLKTQLLANVSHDLRTPLGGILGFSEMLQAGVFGDLTQDQLGATGEIIDSTSQLLSFINNLLNQARIESGGVALKMASFTVTNLVTDTKSMFGPLAQTKGLSLESEITENVPQTLIGDIDWLRQMLANLVGNAIKFTGQGEVRICIFCPTESQWAIQVTDTGPGIPAEAQDYIFEAFRQVDGTVTREHGGSGLGLSIVKQLTIIMGGYITLDSEIGVGSTFTIFLPLHVNQEQRNGKHPS
ncbi:MAG: PAS domain S-box protein [Anaerolineae bacterium]|nr:PAS domain S-box protein [Anaerolineae bacterium]